MNDLEGAAPSAPCSRQTTPPHPRRRRRGALHTVVVAIALLARGASVACTGDCNQDRTVTINELLSGVSISLGAAEMSICPGFDGDGDGRVAVSELVDGVSSALTGCSGQTRAVVVTSDFTTGSIATVGLDPPHELMRASARNRVFRDAVVRTRGDLVYVVNRLYGDNLQILDPAREFATVSQCSTGNGTNPHDIAFASGDKAYMTLFERPELLIVNPAPRRDCGDFTRGTIDLTTLADDDGNPDMDQMAIVGDRLYVALGRLDVFTILRTPAETAALAVIDTISDRLIGSIELTGKNPFSATKGLTVRGGAIYVAEAGLFGVMDGGIERVDLNTQRAEGFFVTEEDLGGDVTDFAIVSDHLAYAIISRPGFTNALIAFDPSTRLVTDTLLDVDGFTLFDLELNDRGELYVADRERRASGIRIFRAADGAALTDGALDLLLPPFEIVFIR